MLRGCSAHKTIKPYSPNSQSKENNKPLKISQQGLQYLKDANILEPNGKTIKAKYQSTLYEYAKKDFVSSVLSDFELHSALKKILATINLTPIEQQQIEIVLEPLKKANNAKIAGILLLPFLGAIGAPDAIIHGGGQAIVPKSDTTNTIE
jgi:hypothetical protein